VLQRASLKLAQVWVGSIPPCFNATVVSSSCSLPTPICSPHSLLQVKAVDAHLSSGGGAITGAVTGVDVRLRTSGGPLKLKSLVGKVAEVDTAGGPLTLGACYADQLHLQSGGRVGCWVSG